MNPKRAIALAAQNLSWWNYLGSLLGIGILGATLYLCLALFHVIKENN